MRNSNVGVMPDKRTLRVLVALVVSMTMISSLLLALEPGPVASTSGVSLQAIDQPRFQSWQGLFKTATPRQWKAIIIHDSGSAQGSASSLDALARHRGLMGLGDDFVINNGTGRSDGLIEVGYRWRQQKPGAYITGSGARAKWCNNHAIGICLIGNGDKGSFTHDQLQQLVQLVKQLQRRYSIPKDKVLADISNSQSADAANFPIAWFREQLLAPVGN